MLIYQLDCLIFSDSLRHWCNKGYDFCCSACLVGAFHWVKDDFVGIGGLSLRSVEGCARVLRMASADPRHLELLNHIREIGAEDVWWGRYAPQVDQDFSVVPLMESMAFSFNGHPHAYLARGAGLPPFACHGWHTLLTLATYYRYLPFREPVRFFKVLPVACFLGWRFVLIRFRQLGKFLRLG